MKQVFLIWKLLIVSLFVIPVLGQDADPPDSSNDSDKKPTISSSLNTKTKPTPTNLEKNLETSEKTEEKSLFSKGNTEISFNHMEQRLTNNYGTWRQSTIDVIHKFSRRKILYGNYKETERFNKRDRQGMIGFYQPLSKKWTLLLEANASPTHRVLPKWSVLAQAERSFNKSLILKGGIRHTKFNTTSANIFKGEVEKYFGSNRVVYGFSLNALEKVPASSSHRFQYTRYYGENVNSVNFSVSFGREIESLGELGILQSNVQNFTASGKHWVKRNIGVTYGLTLHKQGNLYSRRGLNVGIRYRF